MRDRGRRIHGRARSCAAAARRARDRLADRRVTGYEVGRVNYGDARAPRRLHMNVLRVRLDAQARAGSRRSVGALRCHRRLRARWAGPHGCVARRRPDRGRRSPRSRRASRASCCRRCPRRASPAPPRSRSRTSSPAPTPRIMSRCPRRVAMGACASPSSRRSLVAAIVDDYPDVTRIVAECDLCPPATDWRVVRARAGCARVRPAAGRQRSSGRGAVARRNACRRELAMALAQARRSALRLRRACAWKRPFRPTRSRAGSAKRESNSSPARPGNGRRPRAAAFAAAIDLLPTSAASGDAAPRLKPGRLFAPALLLAGAALALHVTASSVEWASLRACLARCKGMDVARRCSRCRSRGRRRSRRSPSRARAALRPGAPRAWHERTGRRAAACCARPPCWRVCRRAR